MRYGSLEVPMRTWVKLCYQDLVTRLRCARGWHSHVIPDADYRCANCGRKTGEGQ